MSEIETAVRERFGDTAFDVLAQTPVLWSGWELDHDVVLVALADGRRELVTIGATRNLERGDLVERVDAYREAVAATEALLRVLD